MTRGKLVWKQKMPKRTWSKGQEGRIETWTIDEWMRLDETR